MLASCSGNGSQWSKMAEPLLHTSPVFRRAVHACADALKPHGVNLLAEFGKEEGWKHPSLAMVGLVAIQVLYISNLNSDITAGILSAVMPQNWSMYAIGNSAEAMLT